jgi:hypothetical protein
MLWGDFLRNKDRHIHKWTHYFPAYERHFSKFQNQSITMLEIGVGGGGSSQMWRQYLGPFARIVGIDNREVCKQYEDDQVAIRIGDQGDESFLRAVNDEFGPFDIVLDDGSHKMDHLLLTFRTLYPLMPINGVYLLEDLHTCYWPAFGGGLRVENSFLNVCATLIHELHASHSYGAIKETEFSRTTLSMHIYDSIVVFERGRHLKKTHINCPPLPGKR